MFNNLIHLTFQGDFIQHLMDLICKDLSMSSSQIQTAMLQSKLEVKRPIILTVL